MPGGFWKRFYLGQRADPLVRAVLSSNLVRRLKPAVPGGYRAFILCLCFGLAGAVSAQEGCSYFARKFEAQTFAASGQDDKAITAWRAAFSVHMKNLSDLLTAADLAFKTDSLDAAWTFLKPAPALLLTWEQYLNYARVAARGKVDPETFMDRDEWEGLLAFFSAQANQDLSQQLRRMAERDQQYRTEEATDTEKMHEADSLNALELRFIVGDLHRLPGYYDVGPEGLFNLELLFIHMGFDDLQYFMPYLLASIRNGEYFANEELAYQIDRLAVSSGEALYIDEQDRLQKGAAMPSLTANASYSVMGVWYELDPASGNRVAWPVFPGLGDAGVDASRARLCLDTLVQYKARTPWLQRVDPETFKRIFQR